jgi:hypothetical protein
VEVLMEVVQRVEGAGGVEAVVEEGTVVD